MGKTMHKRRLLAGVLALLVLLALLVSALYLIAEADHDCTGEDCHVCAQLRLCENLLRRFAAVAVTAAALAVVCLAPAAACSACAVRRMTPVSGRVRLNN